MIESIFTPIISYIQTYGEEILLKVVLAIGVSIAGYILIHLIVNKVKKRVEANSIQEDIYVQRTSNLVGKMIGILLVIFLVLAVFQIIGFDTAIIM